MVVVGSSGCRLDRRLSSSRPGRSGDKRQNHVTMSGIVRHVYIVVLMVIAEDKSHQVSQMNELTSAGVHDEGEVSTLGATVLQCVSRSSIAGR